MNDVISCIETDESSKLKSADSDRMFITVNAGRRGPFNPANALIRC